MSNLHRGFNSLGILLLVVGVVAMWILAEQRNINTETTMLELAEEVVVLKKQIEGLETALAAVPRTEAVRGINANFVEETTTEAATDETTTGTPGLELLEWNYPTTPKFIRTSSTRPTNRSKRTTLPTFSSTSTSKDKKKGRTVSSEHLEVIMTDCEDESIKLNMAKKSNGADYIKMCGEEADQHTNETKYRVITELQIHKNNYKKFTIKCCHLRLK